MSLLGLIQVRGDTVQVKRATPSKGTGGTTQRTWKEHIESAKVLIESITSDRAQRIWGSEVQANFAGWCDPSLDILMNDGLIVTKSKKFIGRRFRVVAVSDSALGPERKALGLVQVATTETFA